MLKAWGGRQVLNIDRQMNNILSYSYMHIVGEKAVRGEKEIPKNKHGSNEA